STDLGTKKEFFVQVGKVLENRNWRALFAMREDYLAGLDPYLQFIPTRFATRFRLEFLKAEEARKAIQKPAENAGVRFTDPAARKLVDDLRRVRVPALTGEPEEQLGPYIEPVQLQVVCQRLWSAIPVGGSEIGEDAIGDLGDVDSALAAYYGERVKAAAESLNVSSPSLAPSSFTPSCNCTLFPSFQWPHTLGFVRADLVERITLRKLGVPILARLAL